MYNTPIVSEVTSNAVDDIFWEAMKQLQQTNRNFPCG